MAGKTLQSPPDNLFGRVVTILEDARTEVVEATRNNWSKRQLERQINSLLFERLLKSRDKKGRVDPLYG